MGDPSPGLAPPTPVPFLPPHYSLFFILSQEVHKIPALSIGVCGVGFHALPQYDVSKDTEPWFLLILEFA